jgi:hypothetical protein
MMYQRFNPYIGGVQLICQLRPRFGWNLSCYILLFRPKASERTKRYFAWALECVSDACDVGLIVGKICR